MSFKKYLSKKIVLLLTLTIGIGTFSAYKVDDRLFEIAKNLDVFATMYKELNALYVDEINPTKSMRIGIQAMLKDLDPYTVFYPEDEIEDYFTMNAGSYNGIGATIEHFEGKHLVVMLFEGSPADKAGVNIGDEVLKINGVDVVSRSDAEFGRLLKGQKGSNVKLQLKKVGNNKTSEVSVARDVVKTPNVPHTGMLNNEVGYVQLTEFSATASKEVKSAILDLKDKGMKKLVLDLRGNPGGLLQMAVEICNFFVPRGQLVVETKGKVKEWNQKYVTSAQPLDTEMPVIVLINGRSASASEIVSGTLQDYDRGVLVGSRSYGKGLVQITKELSYRTQMKITTSKYYIPSGRCVQAIDYGNKGVDGQAAKLPDSLRSAFKTKAGRTVLDGAGVDPDIEVKKENQNEFVRDLIKQKLIFNYANKYYFENKENKPKENFSLSNKDKDGFDAWLSSQKNTYKTPEQKSMEALIKASKASGEYSKMKSQLDELQKIADGSAALLSKKFSDQIKNELELEILSRYYYQKAMKFVSFEKDTDIQEALRIFKTPNLYTSILAKK